MNADTKVVTRFQIEKLEERIVPTGCLLGCLPGVGVNAAANVNAGAGVNLCGIGVGAGLSAKLAAAVHV